MPRARIRPPTTTSDRKAQPIMPADHRSANAHGPSTPDTDRPSQRATRVQPSRDVQAIDDTPGRADADLQRLRRALSSTASAADLTELIRHLQLHADG
jgi:hypothetical protein